MWRGHSYKNIVAFGIDVVMATLAGMLGLYLRLGFGVFDYPAIFWMDHVIIFIIAAVISDIILKIYKNVWRFFNLDYLLRIVKFATLLIMIFLLIQFFDTRLEKFPRATIIIDWLLIICFVCLPRILYRAYYEGSFKFNLNNQLNYTQSILIVGLDKSIERFIQESNAKAALPYDIIGIVDKDQNNIGRMLFNVPVLNTLGNLRETLLDLQSSNKKPSRILMSSETILQGQLQKIISICEEFAIPVSRLPKITSLSHLNNALPFQPIPLEELLKRSQKNLNITKIRAFTRDMVVLVTGAGGSIGSELVRQISQSAPKQLLLLDHSEFLLYEIEQECKMLFPEIQVVPLLVNICDKKAMEEVFYNFKPQLVFHAAALKHVPLLEKHRANAVETNIFGTINVIDLAVKYKCQKFIMISTDKAVDPSSFMGASKRMAEMYCQINGCADTKINIVRFGNVLGSNGSVVPLFEKQIAMGGPVTVTDPQATRFFMTISEAAGLVLQAASMEQGESNCNIYVLDMGEPVKIVDLAHKMILLASLKPDVDIKINFIGLRPGEKLHEILVSEYESLTKTSNKDILIAQPKSINIAEFNTAIEQLKLACEHKDEEKCQLITLKTIQSLA